VSGAEGRADLSRWRLVLGEATDTALGSPLGAEGLGQDAALEWLYGRDPQRIQRGERSGGLGASQLTSVDWLEQVHTLFPQRTIERLERDAVEQYGIEDLVTDPGVLSRVTPNATLLKAVLRTKHLMNPEVLALARTMVAAVVAEMMQRLATTVRQAFSGARARHPSQVKQASGFDVHRTIRANLAHWDAEQKRLGVERPYFFSRQRRSLDRWQIIIVVDQSGSMAGSVIHAAVTAGCLWNLPGIRTHLVAFDTEVVDLTSDVTDPVDLLMKVQLGGGTDIAKAVRYAAQLIDNPRRAIVVLITDFYEGGDPVALVRGVSELVSGGSIVLGLAALDDAAAPAYDRDIAQRLANVGAHVGAMTPGELAEFIAEAVGR